MLVSQSVVFVLGEVGIRLRDDNRRVSGELSGRQRGMMLEKGFEGCVGVF